MLEKMTFLCSLDWLTSLDAGGTPFLVGVVLLPLSAAQNVADKVYDVVLRLILIEFSAFLILGLRLSKSKIEKK
jgi:hypothetical protein